MPDAIFAETEIGGLASRIAAERTLLNQRMQGIFRPLLAEWQAAHAGAAQNLTLGEIANRCLQVVCFPTHNNDPIVLVI